MGRRSTIDDNARLRLWASNMLARSIADSCPRQSALTVAARRRPLAAPPRPIPATEPSLRQLVGCDSAPYRPPPWLNGENAMRNAAHVFSAIRPSLLLLYPELVISSPSIAEASTVVNNHQVGTPISRPLTGIEGCGVQWPRAGLSMRPSSRLFVEARP